MGRKTAAVLCGVAALSMGLTGCAAGEVADVRTATPDQVANTAPDPWDQGQSLGRTQAQGVYLDGVYTGVGRGMEGTITATLLVQDNRISCVSMTQDGETPSVGGFEAIRDGVYAQMIDDAQGADIDTISGATITTAGVRQAVEDALAQAQTTSENGGVR